MSPAFRRSARAVAPALLLAAAAPGLPAQPPGEPESAAVVLVDSIPCIGVNDLARLLGATKYWRADVRKLVLRAGPHSLKLTQDNPFAVVDDRAFLLPGPVRMRRSELHVPIQLLDFLWIDPRSQRVRVDPRGSRLQLLPAGVVLGLPQIVHGPGSSRITLRMEDPDEVRLIARGRSRFRLRFPGPFTAPLPDSLPPRSLLLSARVLPTTEGAVLELAFAPEAEEFRFEADTASRTLVLEAVASPRGGAPWQRFAPEQAPGMRWLRVIVLDPGHGGADGGARVEDAPAEKDLTLALARELREQIARRARARVVLTRDADRNVPQGERAEIANRARADIVLSLHFDAYPQAAARGMTAYVPRATDAAEASGERAGPARLPVTLVPWRDAATRYAAASRDLAEDLITACDLRGLGPGRVREQLPYPLLGVNAPGVLLECGTLTSPRDRARLRDPRGVRELAATLAEAIDAWQRKGGVPQ